MLIDGQNRIAEVFGVTQKTINEWQHEGLPVVERGGPGVASRFDTALCIRWLVDRELAKVRVESPRDRLHRLQGDQAALRLQIARREYAPIGDLERAISLVGRQVARILETVVPTIRLRAPHIDLETLDLIDGMIVNARNTAAAMDLSALDEPPDTVDD